MRELTGVAGWAPDAPGTGEAADAAVRGRKKAFEANDTQDEATGAARQGADLTPEDAGQSLAPLADPAALELVATATAAGFLARTATAVTT